jgi:hypothetical protein
MIQYPASDMNLCIHNKASYLLKAKEHQQSGDHFYLGNKPSSSQLEIGNNAILLTSSTIMCNVMSSAAEAECGTLFNNTKGRVALHHYPLQNETPPTSHPSSSQQSHNQWIGVR